MNKRLLIMWVAIILLVATWAYPPWVHYPASGNNYALVTFRTKWAPLFDTWQGEDFWNVLIFRIDYARLLLVDAIIVGVAAGLIVSFRKSN